MTTNKYIKSTFFLFLIVFTIVSCYKKKDTIVIINVRENATNEIVVGADVRLYYQSGNPDSTRIDVSATSNPQGQAVFNFNDLYQSGQAGFAVLDLLVNGTKVSVIQIEEEVTTEETVYI
ncbi:MAG: hypothetical protein CMD01_02110 [Flavobacteriales bacterium]|nr:hypothetical protein [Flavobacteriales bacterium]MBG16377.1 hypothetical protein [Crocinitomicaceae bacterium]|tara:strand:- start:5730 stop:6089 length:360 start_codon:yes stop_codon:yes gene_type:complete